VLVNVVNVLVNIVSVYLLVNIVLCVSECWYSDCCECVSEYCACVSE
jgi:hypothetical protein